MSRFGKVISSPRFNIALFVVAALLLLASVVGGPQAALSYYSDTYLARLAASDIGVTLVENDQKVAWRDYEGGNSWNERTWTRDGQENSAELLSNLLPQGETFQVGREYAENLAVQNTGTITQYVRVSLLKYWEDADGNKVNTVSPDLIRLGLNTERMADGSAWLLDEDSSTKERTVLYYNRPLASGETTHDFCKTVSVDGSIASKVTQTEQKNADGTTTITTTYDYNGLRFCLEANVYAVQEHNVVDAIHSAWGRNMTISDGTLSLG